MLLASACGIWYELLIGTLGTYLLGSSIWQFSITIGIFLTSMGIGSWLSGFIENQLLQKFLLIELILGITGAISAWAIYASYVYLDQYHLTAYTFLFILGTCIGLEVPLVTRMVREYAALKKAVAQVLSFDYAGSFLASILFPAFLLPYLGLLRTAFLVGALNLMVVLLLLYFFRQQIRHLPIWITVTLIPVFGALAGVAGAGQLYSTLEQKTYQDPIVYSRQSRYQRIILTSWKNDLRLFLNGHLQFSSTDEFRYHEPLVHLPLAQLPVAEKVLVLGGGDGLVARELLKYPDIQHIDVVDLDPDMTALAMSGRIGAINQGAFRNPKVKVHHQDAFNFLRQTTTVYDCIIADLPDPSDAGLGKLYSREFYGMMQRHLSASGIMVTQATSPWFAPEAFWCIHRTVQSIFPGAQPYTSYVPSFGLWGFIMAGPNMRAADSIAHTPLRLSAAALHQLQYLKPSLIPSLFVIPKDIEPRGTGVSTLDQPQVVTEYTRSLKRWR